ncbi:MAG: hypothetical protein ACRD1T_27130, partial [Acidimicrobiia bacterium]
MSVEQIRQLAPETWSFPELQTALDAEVAAHCATRVPALNLDASGWGLTYCRELDADRDAWRFTEATDLEELRAVREGLRWKDPSGGEWWPLVEGRLFYQLEFPAAEQEPRYWVNGDEVRAIEARHWKDGTSAMEHYRVAWRDVASATNERSAIATVLPPRTAAKDSALTVFGGSLDLRRSLRLAALMCSLTFDYLIRFAGKTHLKYAAVDNARAPSAEDLDGLEELAIEVLSSSAEFTEAWHALRGKEEPPSLDSWEIARKRGQIDARVAFAYGLTLEQFAAVTSSFSNIDRSEPMLPG